jgi:hypothetical protein
MTANARLRMASFAGGAGRALMMAACLRLNRFLAFLLWWSVQCFSFLELALGESLRPPRVGAEVWKRAAGADVGGTDTEGSSVARKRGTSPGPAHATKYVAEDREGDMRVVVGGWGGGVRHGCTFDAMD